MHPLRVLNNNNNGITQRLYIAVLSTLQCKKQHNIIITSLHYHYCTYWEIYTIHILTHSLLEILPKNAF